MSFYSFCLFRFEILFIIKISSKTASANSDRISFILSMAVVGEMNCIVTFSRNLVDLDCVECPVNLQSIGRRRLNDTQMSLKMAFSVVGAFFGIFFRPN